MKKLTVALSLVLAFAGCALFSTSRPATVAGRLALCQQLSTSALEYQECCEDVARDTALNDGGARDAAACKLGGGLR